MCLVSVCIHSSKVYTVYCRCVCAVVWPTTVRLHWFPTKNKTPWCLALRQMILGQAGLFPSRVLTLMNRPSVCACVCVLPVHHLSVFTHTNSWPINPFLCIRLSCSSFLKKKKKHPILPHSTSLPLYQPNPPPAHFAIFHSLRVNAHYILPSRFRPN